MTAVEIRGTGELACPTCRVTNTPLDIRSQSKWWALATYLCGRCRSVHQYPWPRADRRVADDQLELLTIPEPEVRAREASKDETPRSAGSLVKAADLVGLASTVRYARGTTTDQYGKPVTVVDSVVVVASEVGAGVLAIWTDRKFHRAWTWAPDEELTERGARDAVAWLKDRPVSEVAA